MKKPEQNGFAVLEGLLIALIVVIIGGTGYYVWHAKQQTDKILNSAQSESTVAKSTKKTTSSSTKFLVIKELNIEIPVPASAPDLNYYWAVYSADLYSDALGKYIKKQDPSCIPTSASDSTAGKAGSIFNSNSVVPADSPAKQIIAGRTFYYYGPTQLCDASGAGAPTANARITAVQNDITAAFHQATGL